jgi:pyruvate dehydrogenase E1 component alpha subunit
MDHDPLPIYHQRLLRLGVPEGQLTAITQEVARRVDEATEFAKAGNRPQEHALLTDMWADGGSAWRN